MAVKYHCIHPQLIQSLSVTGVLGNHKINHLLFADDLLLLSENKEGLQHCLNKLNSYYFTWRLQMCFIIEIICGMIKITIEIKHNA
jgi:hypothetical protein